MNSLTQLEDETDEYRMLMIVVVASSHAKSRFDLTYKLHIENVCFQTHQWLSDVLEIEMKHVRCRLIQRFLLQLSGHIKVFVIDDFDTDYVIRKIVDHRYNEFGGFELDFLIIQQHPAQRSWQAWICRREPINCSWLGIGA